jgi:hypothetical protein
MIVKALSNILQMKIKFLIDQMQPDFIKGRSIVAVFSTAAEMVQFENKNKKPIIFLNLDFQMGTRKLCFTHFKFEDSRQND